MASNISSSLPKRNSAQTTLQPHIRSHLPAMCPLGSPTGISNRSSQMNYLFNHLPKFLVLVFLHSLSCYQIQIQRNNLRLLHLHSLVSCCPKVPLILLPKSSQVLHPLHPLFHCWVKSPQPHISPKIIPLICKSSHISGMDWCELVPLNGCLSDSMGSGELVAMPYGW